MFRTCFPFAGCGRDGLGEEKSIGAKLSQRGTTSDSSFFDEGKNQDEEEIWYETEAWDFSYNDRLYDEFHEAKSDELDIVVPFREAVNEKSSDNFSNSLQSNNVEKAATESSVNKNNKQPLVLVPMKSVMATKQFTHFPSDKVSNITLDETAELFLFLVNDGCEDCILRQKKSVSPNALNAILAMETAANESLPAIASIKTKNAPSNKPSTIVGDIDALKFCAALRIFADWRLIRQVPDGYTSYAVGMNLGHKDIILNLKKIEASAHAWARRRGSTGQQVHCLMKRPTLQNLLQEEIDVGVHHRGLSNLEDDSAAIGLIWIRRQLEYQCTLYRNFSSDHFASELEAVRSAYKEVYFYHHGWAVRQIFEMSFKAAPPLDCMLYHMNRISLLERSKVCIPRKETLPNHTSKKLKDPTA